MEMWCSVLLCICTVLSKCTFKFQNIIRSNDFSFPYPYNSLFLSYINIQCRLLYPSAPSNYGTEFDWFSLSLSWTSQTNQALQYFLPARSVTHVRRGFVESLQAMCSFFRTSGRSRPQPSPPTPADTIKCVGRNWKNVKHLKCIKK